jgi:hypothetical protein
METRRASTSDRSASPRDESSTSPPAQPKSWLSHAFAIDPEGPAEPTEEQAEIIDRLCREIVRRRLTAPALLSLEVSRPLNYVGSQFLHFVRPILAVMLDTRRLEHFATFLESRGSVETLVARLESAENEYQQSKTDESPVASATDGDSGRNRETARGG